MQDIEKEIDIIRAENVTLQAKYEEKSKDLNELKLKGFEPEFTRDEQFDFY